MPFIGDQATANSKIKKHVFTATGSQVDFTVASNASDELQVFLNGVLLKFTDDYTYTTSTVTLGSGATVSDIVEVHVYQSFALVDAVKASGDTMTGELEVPTVKLSSNIIKASDGGSTITLDTSDNVSIAGDLTVTGGDIKSSGGTTAISVSGANTTLAGTANNIGTVTSGIIMTSTNPRLTITRQTWAGDTTGTTETAVADYYNWQNTKASSTVFIEMTFPVQTSVSGGVSSLRYGKWRMYYSTSSVSDGATSSFGTALGKGWTGRTTATSTSNANAGYGILTLTGTFTTSESVSTDYYFGITSGADGTYTRCETWGGGIDGTLIKILEY
jgi:hypothetical protein